MINLVFDIETDGFYSECTVIHCIVLKDIETGIIYKCFDQLKYIDIAVKTPKAKSLHFALSMLQDADTLTAHNGIDFDIRVIEKLYGIKIPATKIIDTYLLSCMLEPDRSPIKGCKAGTHSLEAWGYRVGRGKPSHDDWENFSLEMLHRCVEDVKITELVVQNLGVL